MSPVVEVEDAMLEAMQVRGLEAKDVEPSPIRGLKRVEYEALIKQGAFEGEYVELLHGQIVTMSPEGFVHMDAANWLAKRLIRAFGDDELDVLIGVPFAADAYSMPQPDVYVGKPARGRRERPDPATAQWLIEVSNTSLRKDRGVKAHLYASCGVLEYWVVDVSGASPVVEVYTDPADGKYTSVRQYRDGDIIRPKLVPIDIAVADIPR